MQGAPMGAPGAGYMPPMGMPGAGMPPGGAAPYGAYPPPPPPPPGDPNYRFGERWKNFKTNVKIPKHTLKFDEAYFLKLLAGSISLTRDEKKKIVESIPKLRQEQIDELIDILEEEKEKFIELSPKHSDQLKKLEEKHAAEWQDLENMVVQESKKQEDQSKAEEIRKQLGL
jgi:hypothetical protein